MLLDTASLYFRAFFGVPEKITAPDGTPVNAVRGLLDFIARLVTDRQPTHLVACLDADWRPAFRVALVPSYKAHRLADAATGAETVPPALEAQVPVIIEVLEAFGIAHVGVAGFEADDVIGTLAARSAGPVDVVTGDRDLFQLVDDARRVRVLYTARGVGRHEVIDEAVVTAKYGIPGRAYADFASLRGDPSDGLPGVPGVGDKTAATLINRFGDLKSLIAAADDPGSELSPTVRRKLLDAHDYLTVAGDVVAVRTDVPVPDLDDGLPTEPADESALADLTERWGLGSSVTRVKSALSFADHA
ncbi:flap endonuclease [Phytoactinopolyspora alkaliphila]|uniref:5'-3' exonuclease n=1 Tax=Phytoactinopolyspora alkaliphila TaxID=1783498 RepID=A0A6N9YH84_9ACTN|nr:5'-3' exonuclease H3TH domain-containing protein [Phytoactinopolyspora alkaliphila]NED94239.1 flap endonuclease [Phytoactinopolyspora alkaliphila]